jgi:hypothetical protein
MLSAISPWADVPRSPSVMAYSDDIMVMLFAFFISLRISSGCLTQVKVRPNLFPALMYFFIPCIN